MGYKDLNYDVIIVLGGGIDATGNLSERSLRRIGRAAGLLKDGVAKNLIICGGWPLNLPEKPALTEASAMKARAIELGVPEGSIFVEESSRDTIGNASYAKKKFLKTHNWQSILLVTSASHASRATYIFSRILGNEYDIDSCCVADNFSFYDIYYEFVAKITVLHILNGVVSGDEDHALDILSADGFAEKYKWHPVLSPLRLIFSAKNLILRSAVPRQIS